MITGFSHTGFVVRDLEAMTAFYRDVLGLTVRSQREWKDETTSRLHGFPDAHMRIVLLSTEGEQFSLELAQWVNPPGDEGHPAKNALGAAHLSFSVDDLDSSYREMEARGLRFVSPPLTRGLSGGRLTKSCHGRDPEGNWLEFIERLA